MEIEFSRCHAAATDAGSYSMSLGHGDDCIPLLEGLVIQDAPPLYGVHAMCVFCKSTLERLYTRTHACHLVFFDG